MNRKSGLILYLLAPLFECQMPTDVFPISKMLTRGFHSFPSLPPENFRPFFLTISICERVKRGVFFFLKKKEVYIF